MDKRGNLFDALLDEVARKNEPLKMNGMDGVRMARRLFQLSEIGMDEHGGSNRFAFSKEERQAKKLVAEWMRDAGLTVMEDAAGNVFGRLEGRENGLPVVMTGSHVDTVPSGGHFDGTVGVICALEVVHGWNERGFKPRRPVEVAVFTDEEGTRFGGGFTGSRAMMGEINLEELAPFVDRDGMSFVDAMAGDGLSFEELSAVARNKAEIFAFVELHIEQGKVLESENQAVGIVSGIAGPVWMEIEFTGESDHAGATPMSLRKDSLAAASELVLFAEKAPAAFNHTAVATVGKIEVFPGGVNVIPGQTRLTLDIRDIDLAARNGLVEELIRKAKDIAITRALAVQTKEKLRIDPVGIPERMLRPVQKSVVEEGLHPVFLPSGAGHDAMIIGKHVPMAMIFVRSRGGLSHHPLEWTALPDLMKGAAVLQRTLAELAEE